MTAVSSPAGKQRDAEHEVQAKGGAYELGQVGGHRDDLGLEPEHEVHPAAEALLAQFRQALAAEEPGF